jgi:hypothetical protein
MRKEKRSLLVGVGLTSLPQTQAQKQVQKGAV